jgi:ethanolamine utilization protein EutQ (cupin superfamily)
MKLFSKDELIAGLKDHPYDTNPDFTARVNYFYFSPDGKMLMAYYESPIGWFDAEINGFEEIDYVLEGLVRLSSKNGTLTAKAGDCFLIQNGDRIRWEMVKPSRMIFFLYPVTGEIQEFVEHILQRKPS